MAEALNVAVRAEPRFGADKEGKRDPEKLRHGAT